MAKKTDLYDLDQASAQMAKLLEEMSRTEAPARGKNKVTMTQLLKANAPLIAAKMREGYDHDQIIKFLRPMLEVRKKDITQCIAPKSTTRGRTKELVKKPLDQVTVPPPAPLEEIKEAALSPSITTA